MHACMRFASFGALPAWLRPENRTFVRVPSRKERLECGWLPVWKPEASWYAYGMTKVAKVTVSLPTTLFDFIERRRTETGASRSETVAEMIWQVRHETQLRERETRYEAAYARQPETSEERAFVEAAGESLAGLGEDWGDPVDPRRTRLRHQNSPAVKAGTAKKTASSKNVAPKAPRKPIAKAAKRASR